MSKRPNVFCVELRHWDDIESLLVVKHWNNFSCFYTAV